MRCSTHRFTAVLRVDGAILTEQGRKVLEAFRRLEGLSSTRGRAELLVIGQAAGHAVANQQ